MIEAPIPTRTVVATPDAVNRGRVVIELGRYYGATGRTCSAALTIDMDKISRAVASACNATKKRIDLGNGIEIGVEIEP